MGLLTSVVWLTESFREMVVHHFGDVSSVVSENNTVCWQILGVLLIFFLHSLLVLLPLHLLVRNPNSPHQRGETVAVSTLGVVHGLVLPCVKPRKAQYWLVRRRVGLPVCLASSVRRRGGLVACVGPTGSNIVWRSIEQTGILRAPSGCIWWVSYVRLNACVGLSASRLELVFCDVLTLEDKDGNMG